MLRVKKLKKHVEKNFLKNNSGQGLTEYAIVLSLVAIAAIAVVGLFGGAVKSKVTAITEGIVGEDTTETENSIKEKAKESKTISKKANKITIEKDEVEVKK